MPFFAGDYHLQLYFVQFLELAVLYSNQQNWGDIQKSFLEARMELFEALLDYVASKRLLILEVSDFTNLFSK
jgi:hypothetical protein